MIGEEMTKEQLFKRILSHGGFYWWDFASDYHVRAAMRRRGWRASGNANGRLYNIDGQFVEEGTRWQNDIIECLKELGRI